MVGGGGDDLLFRSGIGVATCTVMGHVTFKFLHFSFLLTTREAASYIISVLSVCLSVCLYSVCLSDDNFRKSGRKNFIFAHAVYLQVIRVKLIYEGHRVTVKVIGAKKVENSYSRSVKLRSAITPVLSNIGP